MATILIKTSLPIYNGFKTGISIGGDISSCLINMWISQFELHISYLSAYKLN